MQVPPNRAPDPGALAMQSMGELSEMSTIATAQMLGGISGMLVSEGLTKLLREVMGSSSGPAHEKAEASGEAEVQAEPELSDAAAMTGLSARAMKEMVTQGVAGRIVALNTLNTYLSLAASEQLRRMGAQLAAPGGQEAVGSVGPVPYGHAPYGQAPYGHAPYGHAPYGQAPYGQAPVGPVPYGKGPAWQGPYWQGPPYPCRFPAPR